MDEYVFIELKAAIELPGGRAYVPANLPLPVRTKTMAGWVQEDMDGNIQLDHLAEDLAMVMGIDETFPHFHAYYEILEGLTGGKVREALEGIAAGHYEKEKPDDAMIVMRTMRFLFPKEKQARFSYALSLERYAQKRLKEGAQRACDFLYEIAGKEYGALLEDYPDYFPARYKLGHYYLYVKQYQAAQIQFQAFLAQGDSEEATMETMREVRETLAEIEPFCLYEEAAAYFQAGQYDQAMILLERILDQNGDWWQAELLLGICLRATNRLGEAMSHLQRASVLKDQEPIITFELAQTHYLLGQYEQAMQAIQNTIGMEREWVDCYLVRAQIHLALNQPKDAVKDLQLCLQLEPEHPTALQLLARLDQNA
jgi:tetratricopeptide (TPR) repeat protein